MSKPKALVFGATGVQGFPVAAHLVEAGWHVTGATRNPLRAATLALDGINAFPLDLNDTDRVGIAAQAATAMFLHLPSGVIGDDAQSLARALVKKLASISNPPLVVFSASGPIVGGKRLPQMAQGVAEVVRRVTKPPLPGWSVMVPSMFLDDVLDCSPLEQMLATREVVYPLPAEQRVRWTTAGRVGHEAGELIATWDDTGEFDIDPLPGATRPLDGQGLADLLAKSIASLTGEPIELRYRAITPDDYAQSIAEARGPAYAEACAELYTYLGEHPELLSGETFDWPVVKGATLATDLLAAHLGGT
jgi:hypothetical protein